MLSLLSDEPHHFDKDTPPGCGKAGSLIPGILGVRSRGMGGQTIGQALSLFLMDVLCRFIGPSPGLLGFEAYRTPHETTYTPSLGSTHWVPPSPPLHTSPTALGKRTWMSHHPLRPFQAILVGLTDLWSALGFALSSPCPAWFFSNLSPPIALVHLPLKLATPPVLLLLLQAQDLYFLHHPGPPPLNMNASCSCFSSRLAQILSVSLQWRLLVPTVSSPNS